MPPQDIPNTGRFAFVTDPQGVPFYVMRGFSDQPSESFAAEAPRDGHCAWNELMTPDPAAAAQFYGQCFGWVESEVMDMGPMGDYAMYRNGPDAGFVLGAMMQVPEAGMPGLWQYYFRVPDIDVASVYVADNRGQVINGPMEIPGGEYVFNAIDPQGAVFSLIGQRTG